jgi:pimeloyl-ACP methyl ester carboxylesterase
MTTARLVELAGLSFRVLTPTERAPAALLVHGIASDADAWEQQADELGAIAYDRRGYGGSAAPEPYGATTVEEQSEDAVRVLDAVGAGPLVVAGDGFGAVVALDLARRHPGRVRALALVDPVLPQFLPDGATWLRKVREDLEAALREGGPPLAVERWLGGRVDAATLGRAQAAHVAFFADVAALPTWAVTRRDLRAIAMPAVVATDPVAPPHVSGSADVLGELLPGARRTGDGDLSAAVRSLAP